uniref:RING-type domain-containing protein n=1 Tax=Romanomermis culicivorax TaxID=13658 RepID=A0A915JXQ9_ROMCU
MSQKLVETLTASESRSSPKECPLCIICHCGLLLDSYDRNPVVALDCGHVFHKRCVIKWASVKASCPNCRKYVDPKKPGSRLFFDQGYDDDEYLTADEGEEDRRRNGMKMKKNERVINEERQNRSDSWWSNFVGPSTTTSNRDQTQNASGRQTVFSDLWDSLTAGGGGSRGQQLQDDTIGRSENIGATIVIGAAAGLAVWCLGSFLSNKKRR